MNIIDDGDAKHNKVYSGEKFIKDGMTKSTRNKRVLQLIILKLEEFVKTYRDYLHDAIIELIKNYLIPYIRSECLLKKDYPEMQEKWQRNKQFIDAAVDIQALPVYRNDNIGYKEIGAQLLQYADEQKRLYDEYVKEEMSNTIMSVHEQLIGCKQNEAIDY